MATRNPGSTHQVEVFLVEILMRITRVFFLYIQQKVVNRPWKNSFWTSNNMSTSIWVFSLKWWVSPTNPWGFPTKNDQHLGCVLGGTTKLRKHEYDVWKPACATGYLCFEVHSLHFPRPVHNWPSRARIIECRGDQHLVWFTQGWSWLGCLLARKKKGGSRVKW